MKTIQSLIEINEHQDRVLNIVKAKYGFKNKSEAVEFITKTYEEIDLQPLYTSNDIKDLPQINNFPGFQNYLRGFRKFSSLITKRAKAIDELLNRHMLTPKKIFNFFH